VVGILVGIIMLGVVAADKGPTLMLGGVLIRAMKEITV
jgi:hypothetical protein